MKKMTMMIFGIILALSLAASGFAAEAQASGLAQEVCPVMGGKSNPNLLADNQGQRVYFCCPACLDLFKKDPDKYLQKQHEQQTAPHQNGAGK